MNIVVATDSFKGSMRSDEAGAIIAEAFRECLPDAAIKVIPIADGGEGTTDAVVRATGGEIRVACDVSNPLLGERGAARVFGPQKGATSEMVEFLEEAIERGRENLFKTANNAGRILAKGKGPTEVE